MGLLHCLRNSKSDIAKWEHRETRQSVAMFWGRLHSYPEFKNATPKEQKNFLRFAIEVVKRDFATHAAAGLLAYDVTEHRVRLFPLRGVQIESGEKPIPFAGRTVVSQSYQRDKFFPAIRDIFEEGFCPTKNYFSGLYFPDWELIFINNGIHHLAVATALGRDNAGSANCNTVYLKDVYPHLSLNERLDKWVHSDGSEEPVIEPRFALLYALSRELDFGGINIT